MKIEVKEERLDCYYSVIEDPNKANDHDQPKHAFERWLGYWRVRVNLIQNRLPLDILIVCKPVLPDIPVIDCLLLLPANRTLIYLCFAFFLCLEMMLLQTRRQRIRRCCCFSPITFLRSDKLLTNLLDLLLLLLLGWHSLCSLVFIKILIRR